MPANHGLGLDRMRASIQLGEIRRSAIQERRSTLVRRGRGYLHLSTARCWRKARISKPKVVACAKERAQAREECEQVVLRHRR
jgi:hypothetical protein